MTAMPPTTGLAALAHTIATSSGYSQVCRDTALLPLFLLNCCIMVDTRWLQCTGLRSLHHDFAVY